MSAPHFDLVRGGDGLAPRRVLTAVLAVLAALAATALLAPASAGAATARNGVCESGEFCYYFNSDEKGSISDFSGSMANLGDQQPSCYEFRTAGQNGYQVCTKNNAASVWNRTSGSVTVFYNSNYGGHAQSFASGDKGNLDSTLKNQNASHRFGSSGGGGGGSVTGSQAVARAKVWSDAHVPYSTTKTYQGYRTDCSGYVSMAWGLSKPGPATPAMPALGSYIDKSSLRQGDALLNSAAGAAGHVVLFDKWANSAHTSYWGYEESGSHGAIHRTITYPYFSGYGTFKPFHYSGLK